MITLQKLNSDLYISLMKLNEICEVYSGYAIKEFNNIKKGLPVIKIGNILTDGTLNLGECQFSTEDINEKYHSKKGDIYVALSGATTGKLGIMEDEKKYIINQRVGIIRLKQKSVSQSYIKFFLLKQTERIIDEATGCAQPNISPKQIGEYDVPVFSEKEMLQISDILNNIVCVIKHYKAMIKKYDDLIKARFIEMFGDPENNPNGWMESPLSEKLSVLGGFAFKSDKFSEISGIPILRIGNINSGHFKPVNMVYWKEDENLERYLIYPGDLVMSLTGTVGKDDYGNVCILGDDFEKYYLNQRNAKLEIQGGINKFYLSQLLTFTQVKKKLTGISRGIRQANISNKDILNLVVPIPPIELQQQFEDFVHQVDKSRFDIKKSIIELEREVVYD